MEPLQPFPALATTGDYEAYWRSTRTSYGTIFAPAGIRWRWNLLRYKLTLNRKTEVPQHELPLHMMVLGFPAFLAGGHLCIKTDL